MTAFARASHVLDAPLRALWGLGVVGGLSDRQLLDGFLTGEGESAELAFKVLMDRHGPMVFRVCTRLLVDANDAEDAFQTTFLLLFIHADRIRDRESVAAWLQGWPRAQEPGQRSMRRRRSSGEEHSRPVL